MYEYTFFIRIVPGKTLPCIVSPPRRFGPPDAITLEKVIKNTGITQRCGTQFSGLQCSTIFWQGDQHASSIILSKTGQHFQGRRVSREITQK
jgi:hypothetical protein